MTVRLQQCGLSTHDLKSGQLAVCINDGRIVQRVGEHLMVVGSPNCFKYHSKELVGFGCRNLREDEILVVE